MCRDTAGSECDGFSMRCTPIESETTVFRSSCCAYSLLLPHSTLFFVVKKSCSDRHVSLTIFQSRPLRFTSIPGTRRLEKTITDHLSTHCCFCITIKQQQQNLTISPQTNKISPSMCDTSSFLHVVWSMMSRGASLLSAPSCGKWNLQICCAI